MKEDPMTDARLREFLLGKLDDEDRARIEDLFLTDSPTRERVLALEEELIDDYLEDSLSQEDKERFVLLYAQTNEQRRRLRISGAIKDWAIREARAPRSTTTTKTLWNRLWTWLRLKPHFVVPIAVTTVIAVVLAVVLLNSWVEQRKHLVIEQELAQLNSPASLRGVPPDMASFDLSPVTVRSDEAQNQIKIAAGTRVIELRLPWTQGERYSTYRAEVRRLRDRKTFTIPNLVAESDGRTIRLRLFSHLLTKGNHQINLTGASAGGKGSSQEYSFVVTE